MPMIFLIAEYVVVTRQLSFICNYSVINATEMLTKFPFFNVWPL